MKKELEYKSERIKKFTNFFYQRSKG